MLSKLYTLVTRLMVVNFDCIVCWYHVSSVRPIVMSATMNWSCSNFKASWRKESLMHELGSLLEAFLWKMLQLMVRRFCCYCCFNQQFSCWLLSVLTQSQQGSIPEHRAKASLALVEGRVDYMSACILLGRATHLDVEMSDLWEGLQLGCGGGGAEDMTDAEAEQACIQVKAEFTWQELQLAIHRSTTQYFINIVEKMYDFIMQQKRRSERTLSTMLQKLLKPIAKNKQELLRRKKLL